MVLVTPKKGAEKGLSMDQAVLGFMHAIGVGYSTNQAKAFLYWNFAAAGGATVAHQALGYRYLRGIGTKANCEQALQHYQIVATKVGHSLSWSGGQAKVKILFFSNNIKF